jgi:hypothetical protein
LTQAALIAQYHEKKKKTIKMDLELIGDMYVVTPGSHNPNVVKHKAFRGLAEYTSFP